MTDEDEISVERDNARQYLTERTERIGHDFLKTKKRTCIKRGFLILVFLGYPIFVVYMGFKLYDSSEKEMQNDLKTKLSHLNKFGGSNDSDVSQRCIYTTPSRTLEKFKADPLAPLCSVDSKLQKKLQINCFSSTTATHSCDSCRNVTIKLPKLCFCDQQIHCTADKKPEADRPMKSKCSECKSAFNVSHLAKRAKYFPECQNESRKPIDSIVCKDGFSGTMCSLVLKRVCSSTTKSPADDIDLQSCDETNEEDCLLLINRKSESHMDCHIFDETNTKGRQFLKECKIRL